MDRITYLLGAGASANAIPTVMEIPQHLQIMEGYLRQKFGSDGKINQYLNDVNELREQLSQYNTIDGYARMLSQNTVNPDNSIRLNKLKSILCGLFIFEQLRKKDKNLLTQTSFNLTSIEKVSRTIDPRYKSFFAKVLNGTKLSDKIKIISWNYDMQIEIGLENNLGYRYDTLQDSCTIYPHTSTERVDSTRPYFNNISLFGNSATQIVKLNGTAGIFLRDGSFYNIYLDQTEYYDDHISTLLDVHGEVRRYHKYNPFLRFAWEQDEHTKRGIQYAQSIIQQTDILVVIGYSFPDFNRPVDIQIFSNNRIKELFIQLPNNSITDVKYNMQTALKNIASQAQHRSNLNDFFIPSQFVPAY